MVVLQQTTIIGGLIAVQVCFGWLVESMLTYVDGCLSADDLW